MTSDAPVISCRNAWKIFGPNPSAYLKSVPAGHSFDDIRADGYIAGVKDVSVDVGRGEMLVIMGLSGSGKSVALNVLEDLGYFAIDNLPISLLDKLTEDFMVGDQPSADKIDRKSVV